MLDEQEFHYRSSFSHDVAISRDSWCIAEWIIHFFGKRRQNMQQQKKKEWEELDHPGSPFFWQKAIFLPPRTWESILVKKKCTATGATQPKKMRMTSGRWGGALMFSGLVNFEVDIHPPRPLSLPMPLNFVDANYYCYSRQKLDCKKQQKKANKDEQFFFFLKSKLEHQLSADLAYSLRALLNTPNLHTLKP